MYLKEFDLDLPYIADQNKINLIMKERNCQYNEATKLDYEVLERKETDLQAQN